MSMLHVTSSGLQSRRIIKVPQYFSPSSSSPTHDNNNHLCMPPSSPVSHPPRKETPRATQKPTCLCLLLLLLFPSHLGFVHIMLHLPGNKPLFDVGWTSEGGKRSHHLVSRSPLSPTATGRAHFWDRNAHSSLSLPFLPIQSQKRRGKEPCLPAEWDGASPYTFLTPNGGDNNNSAASNLDRSQITFCPPPRSLPPSLHPRFICLLLLFLSPSATTCGGGGDRPH